MSELLAAAAEQRYVAGLHGREVSWVAHHRVSWNEVKGWCWQGTILLSEVRHDKPMEVAAFHEGV